MSLKYQVSVGAVRRANDKLVSRKKSAYRINTEYSGTITARISLNGIMHEREISNEKIKEAYTNSLNKYAKKL